MAQIKQYNKKTGVTYVYESHSYWDKERKQHRSDRKLIGKLDPETGKIIPTHKKKDDPVSDKAAQSKIKALEAQIARDEKELQELRDKVSSLQKELTEKKRIIDKIRTIIDL